MKTAIEIRGLVLAHGRRRVLEAVDLEVPEGTCTAILGRNGAGKTTLLHHLMGILPRRAGRVSVLGLDPRRAAAAVRSQAGCVPQSVELPPWMRIEQHLNHLSAFHRRWDDSEARRLLARFGLDPRARWRSLSRGQRAAELLVAALAQRPRLLLLDEPFDGLDPFVRRRALEALIDFLGEESGTVVFAGQSLPEVEALADRVVWIENRGIGFAGELEELRRRTARVAVELTGDPASWRPPGRPMIERGEGALVLTYLDWSEELESRLAGDPRVSALRPLARDLADLFASRLDPEIEKCAS